MVERVRRLFCYDDWANRETLESMKKAGAALPPRSLRYLGHILAAQWLWMARMLRKGATVAVWPEPTLDQSETQVEQLRAAWESYLSSLTEAKLAEPVTYTNTKGERWANTVEDVLTHVIMHSAYHRAQIAADLRAAGFAPAYTDFIHAVRQGIVK